MRTARKRSARHSRARGYLRISEVARMVGISPTILRAWENLGLVSPARTQSKYRLYSPRAGDLTAPDPWLEMLPKFESVTPVSGLP